MLIFRLALLIAMFGITYLIVRRKPINYRLLVFSIIYTMFIIVRLLNDYLFKDGVINTVTTYTSNILVVGLIVYTIYYYATKYKK